MQAPNHEPQPGCAAYFLGGLSDGDAMDLWRECGAGGSRGSLVPVFNCFDNHPLLIQALAGEVADNPGQPGDFEDWKRKHPDFERDLFRDRQNLVQVKSHVLYHALHGLDAKHRRVLHTQAAFRMPTTYETLVALFVKPREEEAAEERAPLFKDEAELDRALTLLVDRGLLGWDRRPGVNRYDLHPIVRGVVWSGLSDDAQADIHRARHDHFESVPMMDDWQKVESLEDLTPAIELYHTLVELGRYEEAFAVFRYRLSDATLWRLSAGRQRVGLVERLFPNGTDQLPALTSAADQSYALNALALGYDLNGCPETAIPVYRRKEEINKRGDNWRGLMVGLQNVSDAQRLTGHLRSAEASARAALVIARGQVERFQEAAILYILGRTLFTRGATGDGDAAFERSLRIAKFKRIEQLEGVVNAVFAEALLRRGDPVAALRHADRAWKLAAVNRHEADFIRAARVQGTAALRQADLAVADERLHHALTRALACNRVEEELPTLIALAELHLRKEERDRAREVLEDVWEGTERGPYPLFHADALNLLAEIERAEGEKEKAVEAATRAHEKAWCDGPPFAYHWGLERAKGLLGELAAEVPGMTAFDEAKFEPMPEVEINPAGDQFSEGTGD